MENKTYIVKTHELNEQRYCVAEVPEDVIKVAIFEGNKLADNWADEEFIPFATLPEGSWQLLGRASDIVINHMQLRSWGYKEPFKNLVILKEVAVPLTTALPSQPSGEAGEMFDIAVGYCNKKKLSNRVFEIAHTAFMDGAKWQATTPPLAENQEGQEEKELDDMTKEKDYWYNRCYHAEKFIEESPCDPDITADQIKAHKDWKESQTRTPSKPPQS